MENVSSADLVRLLLKEPNQGGPFDPVKVRRTTEITESVKNTLSVYCKRKDIPMPQLTAMRFGKTELSGYSVEAMDKIWMPYVIAMIGRQQCPNVGGVYMSMLHERPDSETLKGIYDENPFVLRGIRLQLNSKIHTLRDLLSMAMYIEAETKEPVALSINGKIYDWSWSLGIADAH